MLNYIWLHRLDNIMKKLSQLKKIVIAIILAVVVIIIAAISVLAYHNYKNTQAVNSIGVKIASVDKKFIHTTDESSKFTILKSLENDFIKAENSEKHLTIFDHFSILIHQDSLFNVFSLSISNRTNLKYQNEISKLKKLIIGSYDIAISKDTLTNVDTITDKSALNTAETNLSTELKLITSEKDIVTTSTQLNAYTTKINALTTSYAARVKAIEDAEAKAVAEAKAKADAEAAAEAVAKEQAAASSSSNSTNSNSSSSGKSSNNGDSLRSKLPDGQQGTIYILSDGTQFRIDAYGDPIPVN